MNIAGSAKKDSSFNIAELLNTAMPIAQMGAQYVGQERQQRESKKEREAAQEQEIALAILGRRQ